MCPLFGDPVYFWRYPKLNINRQSPLRFGELKKAERSGNKKNFGPFGSIKMTGRRVDAAATSPKQLLKPELDADRPIPKPGETLCALLLIKLVTITNMLIWQLLCRAVCCVDSNWFGNIHEVDKGHPPETKLYSWNIDIWQTLFNGFLV